ncbi:carbohydrate ABC transporter permease [Nonomuraea sp. NPDC050556]|uniref:carbohydrate ABC transporter permease n=1 Tax=Nonomuraea sp. NPDC050556 TaxID=3364369 RepID=UPI0037AAD412
MTVTQERRSPARTRAAARPPRSRHRLAITLFLLPALVLFFALVLAPILLAVYTSFFKWNGMRLPTNFTGADNYARLITSDVFLGDMRNLIMIVVLTLVVQLPLALGIALLLNQRIAGRAIYRLVFFAPYVLSEAITAVLFAMILAPDDTGLANAIVGVFGLSSEWFADESTVLPALFLVMTWKYFGFHTLLYLAGRQSIPKELIEAAQIDGANPWQTFRGVTLPLLGPTIRISAFLAVIGTIQLFDLVWIITGGGPSHSSETLAVTMMQFGFKRFQIGYASAISVVMFLISMVFALLYQRYVMRRDLEGATLR